MSPRTGLRLSVVVAAQDAGPNLRNCVAALLPQIAESEMEILVPDGSGRDRATGTLGSLSSHVKILPSTARRNVPQLWTTGIQAAQGQVIALTIENCIPAPDWAKKTLEAHTGTWAAVGGAIEMASAGNLVDWAVYFSRYSNYIPPFEPRVLDDVAGDNCSYRREALGLVKDLIEDGFWETFIHSDMRRRGEQIFLSPLPVVTYGGGLSAFRFFRRRFVHGRYFAARRSRDFTTAQRILRSSGSVLVPLILIRRISRRIWSHRRYRKQLVLSLPIIACFVLAWAVGEAFGYLQGASAALKLVYD